MKDLISIAFEPVNQPDVIALIDELDAYQKPLYPPESYHGVDIDSLARSNVLFAVARSATGIPVACGGIALEKELGELKRMYTKPSHRGQGIARRLLGMLESAAHARGCRRFALETGYLQAEALSLYERCGYRRCGPFGIYKEDPNSVFMLKETM
jgi:putative acetyltransferase